MMRIDLKSLALVAVLMPLLALQAQEAAEDDPVDPATDVEESEDVTAAEDAQQTEDEELIEDGLDQQGFEKEDDDDFIPTEEIGTDQSIPFPTDI